MLVRFSEPQTWGAPGRYATLVDDKQLHMLMEYVQGGEIFTQLRKVERFNIETARFYAASIVLALVPPPPSPPPHPRALRASAHRSFSAQAKVAAFRTMGGGCCHCPCPLRQP